MENNTSVPTMTQAQPPRELSSNSYSTKAKAGMTSTPTEIFAVHDLGGTFSRTIQLYENTAIEKEHHTNLTSTYAILEGEDSEESSILKSPSNKIEDNLEIFITEDEVTASTKQSWFPERTHILKGKLLNMSTVIKTDINNQHSKTEDIGIFINHLVNLAVVSYKNNTSNAHVKTAVTIPVGERYSNPTRLNRFIDRLSGIYKVEIPRLDYEVTITIKREDVFIESEAETAYYFLMMTDEENEELQNSVERNLVIVDMGRTTLNLSLIASGSAASGRSRTAKYGGDNLVAALHTALMSEFVEVIEYDQAEKALETGYVEIGSSRVPIGAILKRVKLEVTRKMISEYIKFMQGAQMTATQIFLNIFIGRTMGHTGELIPDPENEGVFIESDDFSPSIGELFTQQFKKFSSSAQGYISPNLEQSTVLGLALSMSVDWDLISE